MRRALSIASVAFILMAAPSGASASGPGKILGTVNPIAIAPEVEVCLVETRPSETCTSPAADGTYELGGLSLGPSRIEFIPSYRSRYVAQYYSHAHTPAEATVINLTTSAPQRTEVNATLELGGGVEGTVTAASGGGALSGVEVCVLEAGKRASFGCAESDEAGDYALGGLPAGSYKVGFWGRGRTAEYAPAYYDEAQTASQAAVVGVGAGATVTGIDAAMAKGAKVTGSVVSAASGVPLEGIPVCLFASTAPTPSQCVYSGISGAYEVVGLPGGTYQVGFSLGSAEIGGEAVVSEDDGYLTQFYNGVANRSEAQTLPLSGDQVVAGIDAQLLTPAPAPPPAPPTPVATNIVAAPTVITAPTKTQPLRCKKGYVKKKVKGVARCVKKKPAKKHRKPAKRHRKQPKKHGTSAKKRTARH